MIDANLKKKYANVGTGFILIKYLFFKVLSSVMKVLDGETALEAHIVA